MAKKVNWMLINGNARKMIDGLTVEVAREKLPNSTVEKISKPPSEAKMERWHGDGYCLTTDGCKTEPDGHCEHGKPSWMLALGYI